MSYVRRFIGLGGMIIRDLRVLGRIRVVALFVGLRGAPMCFSGFFVVLGGFVVVVFWHNRSNN